MLIYLAALTALCLLSGLIGWLICNHVMSNQIFKAAQDLNGWLDLRNSIIEYDTRLKIIEAQRKSTWRATD